MAASPLPHSSLPWVGQQRVVGRVGPGVGRDHGVVVGQGRVLEGTVGRVGQQQEEVVTATRG